MKRASEGVLAVRQLPQEVLRRLLPHPLQPHQRLLVQVVQVRQALDHSLPHELLGELFAQALDVQSAPGGEVLEPSLELGGAVEAGAADEGVALETLHRGAADGAVVGHGEDPLGSGAVLDDGFDHVGDDVPRALHQEGVADTYILALDFLDVVQAGAADGDPADRHRLQQGHGGEDPRAANADEDVLELGGRLPRLELVGHRPAGAARALRHLRLQGPVVELEDDAVDLVR